MSLVRLLKKKSSISLFTTPSHSQRFFIFSKIRQFYKYDISETDAHNPQEALALAEKKAAKIYKTKSTHFLTNGSTSGVIAAVLACVGEETGNRKGETEDSVRHVIARHQEDKQSTNCHFEAISPPPKKVLIWDKAHPSHRNAVQLAGAIPVFYELEKDDEWGIYKPLLPENIEKMLKEQDIKALIVTSPSYEGVVSDIKKIKEACKKNKIYLIVDEAHGALYPFSDKLPASAIYEGADFVIQSLHKTAGGLNPTALLHYCHCEEQSDAAIQKNMDIEKALKMITTTSPSYPLLASIEKNVDFLNSKRGRKIINELIENIENMKKNLPNVEFYHGDITKMLVKVPGMTGFELSERLFERSIEDEITNEKSTMLLCGIGTDFKKLKKLERVLKRISKNI